MGRSSDNHIVTIGAKGELSMHLAMGRVFGTTIAVWGLLLAGVSVHGQEAAAEKAPVRVGVLGVDNYQSVAYSQLFNSPKATGDLTGLKVTAAFPSTPSDDIPDSVENYPKWKVQITKFGVEIVDSVEELFKRCDAVMIMSLDGRRHVAEATAALRAKKRLYIGRPFAANLKDAVAIAKVAEETKTPFFSCSQHRFSPGFIGMRNHPEVGTVLGCDVYGGCATEPHHAELMWQGIHGVETLYTIMGPGCVSVRSTSTEVAEVITGTWSDGRVGTFRGLKKGAVKYSATVFGDKGVSVSGIYGHGVPEKGIVPTKDKYMGYEGLAIEMAKFFKGEELPVKPAETLELFAFMEAAHESKRQNGALIRIGDVLEAAKKK